MKKPTDFLAFSIVVVSGCIGTVDPVWYVEGSALKDDPCTLNLYSAGKNDLVMKRSVSGAFKETFVGALRYDMSLVCSGVELASATGVGAKNSPVRLESYGP